MAFPSGVQIGSSKPQSAWQEAAYRAGLQVQQPQGLRPVRGISQFPVTHKGNLVDDHRQSGVLRGQLLPFLFGTFPHQAIRSIPRIAPEGQKCISFVRRNLILLHPVEEMGQFCDMASIPAIELRRKESSLTRRCSMVPGSGRAGASGPSERKRMDPSAKRAVLTRRSLPR